MEQNGLGAVLGHAVSSLDLQQVHESEVSFCFGFGRTPERRPRTRQTSVTPGRHRGDQATPSDSPRAVRQGIGRQQRRHVREITKNTLIR